MIALTQARLRLKKNDEGIAIVMVIGISMILMLLVTVALGVSLSAMTKSKSDETWNAAITAAYAGIEDYKSKIAADNSYYRYGNPLAPFSAGSSLLAPTDGNPAFGTGVGGTWAVVPDQNATDTETAYFRYEVDNRNYVDSGILKIRATGKVGDTTRSVVANLKQKGFIDFLYYTTYEIGDPVLNGLSATQQANCTKYAYAGRPTSGCGAIAFGVNDEINGPLHSNDQIRACGTTFNGAVTTSWFPTSPTTNAYIRGTATSTGCGSGVTETFAKGKPVSVGTLDMPVTNKKMFNEVRTDASADVARPGCLYTGPTKIVFNANGTMTVRSPWTKVTRVANELGTVGSPNSDCGTPGIGVGQLGHSGGATVNVPERNLIYVQDVQFISTTPTSTQPQYRTGTYPKKSGSQDYNNTDCANSNFIGYPITNEDIRTGVSSAYNCKKGDVFVEGTLDGEVTINAENYIYITNDLRYDSTSPDTVLGLVAQNQIWVWNPIKDWNGSSGNRMVNGSRTIDAAMLSVNKTFQVQNYDTGGYRGQLIVYGAIAQKFRGPVGTGNSSGTVTGFAKEYNYDPRFKQTAPPKFLSPVTTTYGVSTIVESKTAYNPDGSKIT